MAAYKLSEELKLPCLYIAKKLSGEAFPFPEHVTAIFLEYPEPSFPKGYSIGNLYFFILLLGKFFGNLILIAKALRYVHQFRPDIVHLHTPLQIGLAIVVKILYRCPLVLTFHGTDFYRFQKSRALQALVRRFVDFIICIAPDMLQDIRVRLPDVPAVYLDNGVDLDLFTPPPMNTPRMKQIVAVGRLVWQKGYEYLIETACIVLKKHPDYRFIIVGEGEQRSSLETLIRDKGLLGKVILLGNSPQRGVVEHLQQSEIFVMSSVTEGFPKALIEAMACGLPVVTTDVGACPQVVDGCGYVVPQREPEQMATALIDLIEHPTMKDQYGNNAISKAQQYDWRDLANKMEQVYEKLLTTAVAK